MSQPNDQFFPSYIPFYNVQTSNLIINNKYWYYEDLIKNY